MAVLLYCKYARGDVVNRCPFIFAYFESGAYEFDLNFNDIVEIKCRISISRAL